MQVGKSTSAPAPAPGSNSARDGGARGAQGTDLASERARQITTQRAHQANARSVKAANQTLGTVIDLKA